MITLESLVEILSKEDSLVVEKLEDGILVKTKVEESDSVIPVDLLNFIKIYEPDAEVVETGNGFVINCKTFGAQSLMMLLMSVFGKDYKFEVTGEFQVTATKKGLNESKEDQEEVVEITLEELAQKIDSEIADLEIEIHEDGLKIEGKDLESVAEKIDSTFPGLTIELTDDYILVGE
jgi:hypothetical protein